MKKNSITKRFLMYIICVIVVSNVILFGLSYYITYKAMEKQIVNSSQNLMESNIILLNRYFQEIDNLADSIIYNSDLCEVLKNRQDTTTGIQLINNIERVYYHSREDLRLTLYKDNSPRNAYTIYEGSGTTEWGNFKDSLWYKKMEQTGQDRVIVTNNYESQSQDQGQDQNQNQNQSGAQQFIHTIVYKIYDVYSTSIVGYLRIDMDLNVLRDYFIPGYENIDGTVIFDENNTILFSDKKPVEIPDSLLTGLADTIGYYQTDSEMVTYGIAENTGWGIAFSVSKEKMYRPLKHIVTVFWLVLAAVLCITISTSGKLFSIVTENFKRLLKGMEEVKAGNLSARVKAERQDEIGELIQEFNDMVCQVDELVVKVEKNQILLNQAEIKALQQQINPHFIFNILETIMGLASEGLNREVINVCRSMSAMLRYNITFQNHTKLENEITQMKNYVDIIKIRFEDRFEVFYDIDEECMENEIVKFTLQPLVENAVNHGLGNISSGGMIRIRIKKEGEWVSISIFDNGCGIPKEKLSELNSQIHDTIENPLEYIDRYKNLGLMNVNLRLRLFFGEKYHIELFSREGRGTCIYLKIPYLSYSVKEGERSHVPGHDR